MLVTIFYLCMLLALRPYKQRALRQLALVTQLALLGIFFCAQTLKMYEEAEGALPGGRCAQLPDASRVAQATRVRLPGWRGSRTMYIPIGCTQYVGCQRTVGLSSHQSWP